MTFNKNFFIGSGIILICILLLIFKPWASTKNEATNTTTTQNNLETQNAPIQPSPKKIRVLYGVVIKKTDSSLDIEELLLSGEKSGKMLTITISNDTTFSYNKLATKKGEAPSQIQGSIQNIQKDMFIAVFAYDDPANPTTITASSIGYSDTNPFTFDIEKKQNVTQKTLLKGSDATYLKTLPSKKAGTIPIDTEK